MGAVLEGAWGRLPEFLTLGTGALDRVPGVGVTRNPRETWASSWNIHFTWRQGNLFCMRSMSYIMASMAKQGRL